MTPSASAAIEIQDLTVAYHGHIALQEATLSLQPGTICALVGMNGAGKSTLFKALMGFVKTTTGQVRIDGLGIDQAQRHSRVAYVPQSEEVDWDFPVNVMDVVMMGRYGYMNALRIPRAIDRQRVQDSLERVEMWPLRHRQIGELSGGQRKRVFFARALAQDSSVLLLDEPFTGVDVKTETLMIALLQELRRSGQTILISTHDLDSIRQFCDQVILINRRILAYGNTSDIFTPENLAWTFGGGLNKGFGQAATDLNSTDLDSTLDSMRNVTPDSMPFIKFPANPSPLNPTHLQALNLGAPQA
jgi:ABC-type Mn2+/Zn2+ transport system ATPase subunit